MAPVPLVGLSRVEVGHAWGTEEKGVRFIGVEKRTGRDYGDKDECVANFRRWDTQPTKDRIYFISSI
jgi:hypothetical protein